MGRKSKYNNKDFIDFNALLNTIILISIVILLFSLAIVQKESIEYETETGIIIDKYKVFIPDGLPFTDDGGYLWYTIVDCNGTNRTVVYHKDNIAAWHLDKIGDEQVVVYPKEDR